MKKLNYPKLALLLFIATFASCKKDNTEQVVIEDPKEFKYVRVLVSDELTNQLSLITPTTGEVRVFGAKNAKSALYTTASGRFATLVHREFNLVETFDSGFEFHGDHVDTKGTPKFGAIVSNGAKPTHFKTKGDEVIIFNDGDATLSIGKEADFHTSGSVMKTINAGITAHHGAMTKFNNGNYAITVKDGSIAGSLPERVKLINATGTEISPSTIQTTGIHGNASDGSVSLFGSKSGILVVSQTGDQRLIPHPVNFGTAWFGTILETGVKGKFIGYTAAMGAYSIDVNSNQITPIVESKDIMQCKIDYSSKNLLVLLHSGTLSIYGLSTGNLKKEGNILPATAKDEKQKTTLVATGKYVYVTMPKLGEVHQISTENFADIKKIKVSATPYRLTIMGYENNLSH